MVLFILTNSILESIIFVTLFIELFMLTNLNFISSSVVKIKHWKELGLLYEYLLNWSYLQMLHTLVIKKVQGNPLQLIASQVSNIFTYIEPHYPCKNWYETKIGEINRLAWYLMWSTGTLIWIWCFCYEYCTDILMLFANGLFGFQGCTTYQAVTHYTPDILEHAYFNWFQRCLYYN